MEKSVVTVFSDKFNSFSSEVVKFRVTRIVARNVRNVKFRFRQRKQSSSFILKIDIF